MTEIVSLIADLQHPDKNTRIKAAMEIGTAADASAVNALADHLSRESDFFVREMLVWALVRIGAPSVDPMITMLTHNDAATRTQAAHALSKLGDVRAVPALMRALDDASVSVVQKAAYALGALGAVGAIPSLIALLVRGESELRNTLHDALVALGDTAVPELAALFGAADTNVATRVTIVETLGGIGGLAVVAPLAAALHDAAWEVRFAAVQALATHGDPGVLTLLLPITDDAHPHVKLLAARAVNSMQ
jgi:HEAT repeat protein